MSACIGEPISWLRLETFAAGRDDRAVREHLAACPACASCLAEIRADVVALPPLALPEPRRAWWRALVPVFAVAAAAAIALIVLRDRSVTPEVHDEIARVKGVGDVVLGTVRERGGAITDDARTFAAGDRWKLVVTCPPRATAELPITVAVTEAGATTADHPLPPATIACGNRVVVPGAFSLTGAQPHRVCASIAGATACVTLTPE